MKRIITILMFSILLTGCAKLDKEQKTVVEQQSSEQEQIVYNLKPTVEVEQVEETIEPTIQQEEVVQTETPTAQSTNSKMDEEVLAMIKECKSLPGWSEYVNSNEGRKVKTGIFLTPIEDVTFIDYSGEEITKEELRLIVSIIGEAADYSEKVADGSISWNTHDEFANLFGYSTYGCMADDGIVLSVDTMMNMFKSLSSSESEFRCAISKYDESEDSELQTLCDYPDDLIEDFFGFNLDSTTWIEYDGDIYGVFVDGSFGSSSSGDSKDGGLTDVTISVDLDKKDTDTSSDGVYSGSTAYSVGYVRAKWSVFFDEMKESSTPIYEINGIPVVIFTKDAIVNNTDEVLEKLHENKNSTFDWSMLNNDGSSNIDLIEMCSVYSRETICKYIGYEYKVPDEETGNSYSFSTN